jgi:glyoxylase-like metal-dependent hydrolase (beta-lactamase superfamily II)
MNGPVSHGALALGAGITSLSSTTPVFGFGALAVNAFLLEGPEPVLIDAGLPALAGATLESLGSRIDPADVRWIWLTHCDADHLGALEPLLAHAPRARIVTNYLGMGKLSMRVALPPERFHLLNAGQELAIAGRSLRAVAMPSYDAPETMGAFDTSSRTLFSSDCFGALLSEEDAAASIEDIERVSAAALAEGLAAWATVDAPWLAHTDPSAFSSALTALEHLRPELVLGAHLPPARGMFGRLAAALHAARSAPPFVGPDQRALEAMLANAA